MAVYNITIQWSHQGLYLQWCDCYTDIYLIMLWGQLCRWVVAEYYTTKWNKTKLIPSSVFLALFPHCIVSIISKYVQQTKDLTENVKHLLTLISTGK